MKIVSCTLALALIGSFAVDSSSGERHQPRRGGGVRGSFASSQESLVDLFPRNDEKVIVPEDQGRRHVQYGTTGSTPTSNVVPTGTPPSTPKGPTGSPPSTPKGPTGSPPSTPKGPTGSPPSTPKGPTGSPPSTPKGPPPSTPKGPTGSPPSPKGPPPSTPKGPTGSPPSTPKGPTGGPPGPTSNTVPGVPPSKGSPTPKSPPSPESKGVPPPSPTPKNVPPPSPKTPKGPTPMVPPPMPSSNVVPIAPYFYGSQSQSPNANVIPQPPSAPSPKSMPKTAAPVAPTVPVCRTPTGQIVPTVGTPTSGSSKMDSKAPAYIPYCPTPSPSTSPVSQTQTGAPTQAALPVAPPVAPPTPLPVPAPVAPPTNSPYTPPTQTAAPTTTPISNAGTPVPTELTSSPSVIPFAPPVPAPTPAPVVPPTPAPVVPPTPAPVVPPTPAPVVPPTPAPVVPPTPAPVVPPTPAPVVPPTPAPVVPPTPAPVVPPTKAPVPPPTLVPVVPPTKAPVPPPTNAPVPPPTLVPVVPPTKAPVPPPTPVPFVPPTAAPLPPPTNAPVVPPTPAPVVPPTPPPVIPPTPAPITETTTAVPSKGTCAVPVSLNFDTAGNGTTLVGGDYVTSDWLASLGITVTAVPDVGTGYAPNGAGRIFDTSSPGPDQDLGSPNSLCMGGGPGVGASGAPGQVGENCQSLGNVLIIQKSNETTAEYSPSGGAIFFNLTTPQKVASVCMLDVPSVATIEIVTTNVGGTEGTVMAQGAGANGYQCISINEDQVVSLKVIYPGGAIAEVNLCYTTSPPSVAPAITSTPTNYVNPLSSPPTPLIIATQSPSIAPIPYATASPIATTTSFPTSSTNILSDTPSVSPSVSTIYCGGGVIGSGVCENSAQCCSPFGNCGSGPEFCGKPITCAPQLAPTSAPVIGGQTVAPTATPSANTVPVTDVPSLSPSAPCGNGAVGNGVCADPTLCCSKFGFCGSTPEYCGTAVPSPSPSTFCGKGTVGNGVCEDPTLCCSKFGYCGSGSLYCGAPVAPTASPVASSAAPVTVPSAPACVLNIAIDSCILESSGASCSDIANEISASNCANVSFVLTFTIFNEGDSTEDITLYTGGKGNSRLKFIKLNSLPAGQNTSVSERVVVLNGCSGATLDINATAITSGPGPVCEAKASFSQVLPLLTSQPTPIPGTLSPSSSPIFKTETGAPTARGCADSFILDFETAGNGTVLPGGTFVGREWFDTYGISIFAQGPGAFTPNGKARILDSSKPGITGAGDLGLGSPNELCSGGGPGVGNGGAPSSAGANCKALGNVLIVQDSDTSVPEDNEPGGNLVFSFSPPRTIVNVGLLNVAQGTTVPLIMHTASGSRTIQFVNGIGANGYQNVPVGLSSVVKLQVQLPGIGAVTHIGLCTPAFSDSPSMSPSSSPSRKPIVVSTSSPSAAPVVTPLPSASSDSPSLAPSGTPSVVVNAGTASPTAATGAPSSALIPLTNAPSMPVSTKAPFGVCGLTVKFNSCTLGHSTARCRSLLTELSQIGCANVTFVLNYTVINSLQTPVNITLLADGDGNSLLGSLASNPFPPGSQTISMVATVNACTGLSKTFSLQAMETPVSQQGPSCFAAASFSLTSTPGAQPTSSPTSSIGFTPSPVVSPYAPTTPTTPPPTCSICLSVESCSLKDGSKCSDISSVNCNNVELIFKYSICNEGNTDVTITSLVGAGNSNLTSLVSPNPLVPNDHDFVTQQVNIVNACDGEKLDFYVVAKGVPFGTTGPTCYARAHFNLTFNSFASPSPTFAPVAPTFAPVAPISPPPTVVATPAPSLATLSPTVAPFSPPPTPPPTVRLTPAPSVAPATVSPTVSPSKQPIILTTILPTALITPQPSVSTLAPSPLPQASAAPVKGPCVISVKFDSCKLGNSSTPCRSVIPQLGQLGCSNITFTLQYTIFNTLTTPVNVSLVEDESGNNLLGLLSSNPLPPGAHTIVDTVEVNACSGISKTFTLSALATPLSASAGPSCLASATFSLMSNTNGPPPTPSPSAATPVPTAALTSSPTSSINNQITPSPSSGPGTSRYCTNQARINFDKAGGTTFSVGVDVSTAYQSLYGLTISASPLGSAFSSVTDTPVIFDSSNPGSHAALGTPNAQCTPPGPGVGSGGAPGQPGENCVAQGNILVIQDSTSSVTCASPNGGILTFNFANPVGILDVGLLNVQTGQLANVEVSCPAGESYSQKVTGLGTNGAIDVRVMKGNVIQMIVTFPSASAVTYIDLCLSY